jgi:hypothetical protein
LLGQAAEPAFGRAGVLALEERLEVHAGAERVAGTSEDRDNEVVAILELVDRGGDALGDRPVHRIACLRPIDRDHGDAVAEFRYDTVTHACSSSLKPCLGQPCS